MGQPAGHAARACVSLHQVKGIWQCQQTQKATYLCQRNLGLATLREPLEEERREDVDLFLDIVCEQFLQRRCVCVCVCVWG